MQGEQLIARYDAKAATLIFGACMLFPIALGAMLVWPSEFMQQRPILTVLAWTGFALSFFFVWAFVQFAWALIARDGVAIFVRDGQLNTPSGTLAVSDILSVTAHDDMRSPFIEIALKSGSNRRFGVAPLAGDATSIASAIRNALSASQ